MPKLPDRTDSNCERLSPKDVPEFLRAVEFLERFSVISQETAEEWRRRYISRGPVLVRHPER